MGAGASEPYGYPSGKSLRDQIIYGLSDERQHLFKSLKQIGCNSDDIKKFRTCLYYSGKGSVDAFLEHRREFIEIGKSAIAAILMQHEDVEKLFAKGDWYQYFYDKLNASFDSFGSNQVSIITFNYDRSLEQYLITALQNSYGKSESECAAILQQIRIIHIHGQLGFLPWQSERSRLYKESQLSEHIQNSAAGIKIIHDDIDLEKDPEFRRAHEILNDAQIVYIIGFGYNETNVKRLSIPKTINVVGSAYKSPNLRQSRRLEIMNRSKRIEMHEPPKGGYS